MSLLVFLGSTLKANDKGILIGNWIGSLKYSNAERRLAFKFELEADGTIRGSFDSSDEGLKDLPVNKVNFENGKLELFADSFGIFITGTVMLPV